jgi:hypothetical protein
VGVRFCVAPFVLLTLVSTTGFAQESVARVRAAESLPPSVTDRLHELAERLRPFQERLREDDRVRAAGSALGLGIVAYETLHRSPHMSLAFVGTQALRLGLHRQLSTVHSRSGFVVEPSIEQRGFAITFRRRFE